MPFPFQHWRAAAGSGPAGPCLGGLDAPSLDCDALHGRDQDVVETSLRTWYAPLFEAGGRVRQVSS